MYRENPNLVEIGLKSRALYVRTFWRVYGWWHSLRDSTAVWRFMCIRWYVQISQCCSWL